MGQGQLNWIFNYIWGIADDVLRDLYVRHERRTTLPVSEDELPEAGEDEAREQRAFQCTFHGSGFSPEYVDHGAASAATATNNAWVRLKGGSQFVILVPTALFVSRTSEETLGPSTPA